MLAIGLINVLAETFGTIKKCYNPFRKVIFLFRKQNELFMAELIDD